jgi:chitinase
MLFATTLTTLGLIAATANAGVIKQMKRQDAAGAQNVVYWGQNGGGTIENDDLATYCTAEAGIDIVVLSFLYQYGNGVLTPAGTFGQACSVSTAGVSQGCEKLSAAITTCQAAGKKVILSLGGASGSYSLTSQQEAETIGQNLWDSYAKKGSSNAPRPFGDSFVNGFDFDIESNSGNANYQYMIAKLRSNFASDSSNTYYITGAPQCPVPEPNMNEIITTSQFDYLFIQFYNNPGCSVNNGDINFADWKTNIANTPSSAAKLFIGVPASPLGATGTESGAQYYLDPQKLTDLVGKYKSDPSYGGIMMWAAGFSDANVINGCTYAQQAHSILTTGKPC